MLGQTCPYSRLQHRIIHPRLEGWIKRQLPLNLRDSFFVYYHNLQGTFVIAQWVVPGRLFVDVVNLEHSLANFDRDEAEKFRRLVRSPVSGQELAKDMSQGWRDRMAGKQSAGDIMADKWRRRKSRPLKVSMAIGK